MWIVCITSVRHVLTVNGYGGRQTKENEKSWCFKGWETLVYYHILLFIQKNNIAKGRPTTGRQAHLVTTKHFQSRRRRKRDSPAMLPEIP